MCVIITSGTQDHKLSLAELLQVFEMYPDGIGVVSPIGQLHTLNTDDNTVIDVYQLIAGQPFILHGRQATHGKVDASNIHPFRLPDGSWFAHNGVLTGKRWKHETKSDSKLLAEELANLPRREWQRHLATFPGQKFAVWHPERSLLGQGLYYDDSNGCLYSNDYHKLGLYDVGGSASKSGYLDEFYGDDWAYEKTHTKPLPWFQAY